MRECSPKQRVSTLIVRSGLYLTEVTLGSFNMELFAINPAKIECAQLHSEPSRLSLKFNE